MQTAFDNNRTVDAIGVFHDISKASGELWHDVFIFELKCYGLEDELLSLLKNYLQNRAQGVVLNGRTSGWRDVNFRIPQGPALRPLLFLIYINDLIYLNDLIYINFNVENVC